jgi:hypothetical protein
MGSLLSRLACGPIARRDLLLTYVVGIVAGGMVAAAILTLMGA